MGLFKTFISFFSIPFFFLANLILPSQKIVRNNIMLAPATKSCAKETYLQPFDLLTGSIPKNVPLSNNTELFNKCTDNQFFASFYENFLSVDDLKSPCTVQYIAHAVSNVPLYLMDQAAYLMFKSFKWGGYAVVTLLVLQGGIEGIFYLLNA